jgi:hypothetical protein
MKRNAFVLLLVLGLIAALPAWAQRRIVRTATPPPKCEKVGGVLMTNIGAIDGAINLGPVFGDLAGSVAAKQVEPLVFQHYWVTSSGESIFFNPAHLTPSPTDDPNVVAVLWGNYTSGISGGTGKFKNATGTLEYFGLADFSQLTLVLRYRGDVCYVPQE